jgi:hypothetical protein
LGNLLTARVVTLALAGAVVGAPLLIIDLKAPGRFYNMLRIYRTSSPMSFGSFILMEAGNKSADRPDDYFWLTERAPEGASPRRRVDRAIEGRKIGGNRGTGHD